MKTRVITLHKGEVLYDIEALAYKYTEAASLEGKAKDALAADHNDTTDGRILSRMMAARDAQLRKRIKFALAPLSSTTSENKPDSANEYVYNLSVADGFDDNMLEVVQIQMHDYIVRGSLLDWYKKLGLQTIAVDAVEVGELEENIVSTLRTPSYTNRPLQPFGPRK